MVGAGINVTTPPGEGMLSSALSNHDDGEGVIGESMKGISTSKGSSPSNSESIVSGINGARSS